MLSSRIHGQHGSCVGRSGCPVGRSEDERWSSHVLACGRSREHRQRSHVLPKLWRGMPLGSGSIGDLLLKGGFWDVFSDYDMAEAVGPPANRCGVKRRARDAYALTSRRKVIAARDDGRFDDEIVGVRTEGAQLVQDERPRVETALERLGNLHPAFGEDGMITAGGASGLDGGVAPLVLTAGKWPVKGTQATSVGSSTVGVDLLDMGLAPALATRKVFAEYDPKATDIDLWELNEAFAGQVLAVLEDFSIPGDNVDVNGGGSAPGHPIGCSGMRILVTLLHEIKRPNIELGMAALCMRERLGIGVLVRRTR
jgi:acetyl-CoA C-acetyltransferase